MSRKTTPSQFEKQWPLQEPREVLKDRKIRLPPLAQEQIVGFDEEVIIHWNYDPDSGFVFISKEPARKSPYEYADWNKVEDPTGEWTKIRAPAVLPAAVREQFEVEGTYVVYLASPEMLTDENPSAWILSWTQFASLLPETGNSDPKNIEQAISRNPGFMPTSPF